MTRPDRPRELGVALASVREAAAVAQAVGSRIGDEAIRKADRSPVTVADFAAQALIAHRLRQAYPDDRLVAEEDSALLRPAAARRLLERVERTVRAAAPELSAAQMLEAIDRGRAEPAARFWTLDPIDGTQGFLRDGQYVVALALVVDGRVELGVMACPALQLDGDASAGGWVLYATRGGGAYRAPLAGGEAARVAVSSCDDPSRARVLRSVEPGHIDLPAFERVVGALGVRTAPTLMDSQAKHAVIAAGGADLMIRLLPSPDYRDKIWDQAAGSILVEEAGGRVTDRRGAALDFGRGRTLARNEGVVASNGLLHAAVIEALRRPSSP